MLLQRIRERSQSWLSWVIVILITLTFSLWGVHNFVGSDAAPPVAKVDSIEISQTQFKHELELARNQYQMQPRLQRPDEAVLRQQVLKQLINRTLLIHDSQQLGLHISDAVVKQALLELPDFQENGEFSLSRFNAFLAQYPGGPEQLLRDYQQDLILAQIRSGYTETAFSLQHDIDNLVQSLRQKRDFEFLVVAKKDFVADVKPTTTDIEHYYQAHAEQYKAPEQVALQYLHLSLTDLRANIKPDEATLQDYYQQNIANFKTKPRWHLARIVMKSKPDPGALAKVKQAADAVVRQAQAGTSFAELAKQHSSDVVTANQGGDIGWVTAEALTPALLAELQKLSKGGISSPVQTDYGYEIIRLLAVEQEQVKPFAVIKAELTQRYKQQQAGKLFAERAEQLADLTYANPESLAQAAKALALPIKQTALFTREGLTAGLLANHAVTHAAFSDDVLEQGNNSEALELDAENVVVVRVQQHQPTHLKPLPAVQEKIKQALISAVATERIKTFTRQLADALTKQQNVAALLAQHKLQWQQAKGLNRDAKQIDRQLLTAAFRIVADSDNNSPIKPVPLANGDYALIKLQRVYEAKERDLTTKELNFLIDQFADYVGRLEYQFYVEGLHHQIAVKSFI